MSDSTYRSAPRLPGEETKVSREMGGGEGGEGGRGGMDVAVRWELLVWHGEGNYYWWLVGAVTAGVMSVRNVRMESWWRGRVGVWGGK